MGRTGRLGLAGWPARHGEVIEYPIERAMRPYAHLPTAECIIRNVLELVYDIAIVQGFQPDIKGIGIHLILDV